MSIAISQLVIADLCYMECCVWLHYVSWLHLECGAALQRTVCCKMYDICATKTIVCPAFFINRHVSKQRDRKKRKGDAHFNVIFNFMKILYRIL